MLQVHPVAEYDTQGTRLTCLAIAEGRSDARLPTASGKRKERVDDVDDEEEAEWEPRVEVVDASVEEL
ncbi:hypothetical protein JVT61DRAFT_372 [Boletus reticuloceps]|uniref:Uncharacterized protein n=1 Tax=Boletus reticuloceps TaxID=495285 RepID=A0A8I3ADQ7_9AGAM|nr:hypothetical protein JVT61DRAFT_372 [Boletus reticuloceps]